MTLTIVIPTYNRNEILLRNIRSLLGQVTPACRVVILDNHSDIPVAQTLSQVLEEYPGVGVDIIRNRYNVGGNANIIRCFEVCETRYLWVLGDDDTPKPDAIERILADIAAHEGCHFLNYHSDDPGHPPRAVSFDTAGTRAFIDAIDSLGQMMFISSCIYNAEVVAKQLRFGMFYQNSCAPHLAMLLLALGEEGRCHISCNSIVDSGSAQTPLHLQGSSIVVALGLPILLDIPLAIDDLSALKRKITDVQKVWITPRGVIHQLLLMSAIRGEVREAKHLFRRVKQRYFNLDRSVARRIEVLGYSLMMCMPSLSYRIVEHVFRLVKGESTGEHVLRDRTRL